MVIVRTFYNSYFAKRWPQRKTCCHSNCIHVKKRTFNWNENHLADCILNNPLYKYHLRSVLSICKSLEWSKFLFSHCFFTFFSPERWYLSISSIITHTFLLIFSKNYSIKITSINQKWIHIHSLLLELPV